MADKIKVEVEGQTIELEMKDGKFVKPQLLKSLSGFGSGLKPAHEPIIYAQKPIESTYANNAMVHGVAGLNIDGARIGTGQDVPLFSRNTDRLRNRSSYDTGGEQANGGDGNKRPMASQRPAVPR